MTFYFTYGTEGHPYSGGWTIVEAPDRETAISAFRIKHPDKTPGLVNCCSIYDQESFKKTSMYKHGNFGRREREIIIWTRIRVS